ncbi:FAD-dependent monooxygenase [Kitasatospora sp. NPDC006697]|uniref:FAD-dependent monooxygenase n=1 Tax=Kitasatospora sp. NPDC006697 TaxID=3364020 RepID=UPI0036A5EB98
MRHVRVPVLVVGGGTVGLAAGVFLGHHGVAALVVERQDGPSVHPRATGIGPRTVELLHEVGLLERVNAVAIDGSAGNLGLIKGDTLATAPALTGPPPPVPARTASPDSPWAATPWSLRGTCPQNRLDAVLLQSARERGATVAYGTELVSFHQDEDGITARLDGPDGPCTVRAEYLIAADGVRSQVRTALGIPTGGAGAIGTPKVNILFRADLSPFTRGRLFLGCETAGPDRSAMLMTVDGEHDWVLHVGYDPEAGESAADFTTERCEELIRAAVGGEAGELGAVEVVSVLPWRVRAQLADRLSSGRAFLVGDAAHAIPPLGAFGMNTGVADAHNLAWKLALVLRGTAAPALLDSYDAERRPVGALAVDQGRRRLDHPGLHWDFSPAGAPGRAAAQLVNAPVVHLGYRYGGAGLLPSTEDLVLDGSPGSRLPHLWCEQDGVLRSTLELVRSRFTVLAGPAGAEWLAAAEKLGVDGQLVDAPDWPATVGTGRGGALLVRPDGFVAWRAGDGASDPAGELAEALGRSLGR